MKKLYSIPAVMEETGLGRTTIFSLISSGELQSVKVGRRRLIPATALDEYVESLQTDQSPAA